jgi:nucleoside-diphosphate-sugar epimerase
MRLLVLGGTKFVGHAIAAEGLRRGHEVVCAARGKAGSVPSGAKLVGIDRNSPDGLEPLVGERFDGVIDVATMSHTWVARALDVLADNAAHWTFVSSVSAYADMTAIGQTPASPVLEPREEHFDRDGDAPVDPTLYGQIKVASENEVRSRMGDRAFVVRPGLITGPGDDHDRFGYWPARMLRGGRVLVPDVPELLTQIIDVRDLALWIVNAAEQRLAGTYDAISQPIPLTEMLATVVSTVGVDVELVAASPAALRAATVDYWAGPRSLPLWLPDNFAGMAAHDPTPSFNAGMTIHPLPDSILAALEHERALGLDRPRKAGLTPDEEAEILDSL